MKTRNEIVDRLYKAGHISLEEVLILCQVEQVVNTPYVGHYIPLTTSPLPWTTTCSTSNPKIGENSCLTVNQLKGEV